MKTSQYTPIDPPPPKHSAKVMPQGYSCSVFLPQIWHCCMVTCTVYLDYAQHIYFYPVHFTSHVISKTLFGVSDKRYFVSLYACIFSNGNKVWFVLTGYFGQYTQNIISMLYVILVIGGQQRVYYCHLKWLHEQITIRLLTIAFLFLLIPFVCNFIFLLCDKRSDFYILHITVSLNF